MAKTLLSLLILGSLVNGVFAGNPPAVAIREPQTGISFPGHLGPLTYQGVRHWENPALGVCIRQGEEGLIKADIFVYDLGKKNPGDRPGVSGPDNAL